MNSLKPYIGLFGKVNTGKSTLMNILFSQEVSIVSPISGTTTDVVQKSIEINPIGPCIIQDTPGIGDKTQLGEKRLDKTHIALQKSNVALFVVSTLALDEDETEFLSKIKSAKIPYAILLYPKNAKSLSAKDIEAAEKKYEAPIKQIDSDNFISEFKKLIPILLKDEKEDRKIVSHLVNEKDLVLLIMPQDDGAPKGRLILPQMQTIRELLDKNCIIVSTTPESLKETLASLSRAPKLAITDSKVFDIVYPALESICPLTSFSVLFAYYKGDGEYAYKSAQAIKKLTKDSKVLIAECCSHAPVNEDIGRVVLPRLLRKNISPYIQIDFSFGTDFPKDISKYDLVIQCGGCMFTSKYILARTQACKDLSIPMTNYGMAIACINGILDKIKL